MNHIYKTVWNAGLQAWVAVSELAKGKGKTKSKHIPPIAGGTAHRMLARTIAFFLLASPMLAQADSQFEWQGTNSVNWWDSGNWWDPDNGQTGVPSSASTITVNKPNNWSAVLDSGTGEGLTLDVGTVGFGQVTISSGATLNIGSEGRIGSLAAGNGSVDVTGAGSTLTSGLALLVGQSGTGALNISNGGTVESGSMVGIGVLGAAIGRHVGSNGTVIVDGTGSSWTIGTNVSPSQGLFDVGSYGTGTITISNGGSVISNAARVGTNGGSTGTATVDGSGSSWTSSGSFVVAQLGTGTLNIINGGNVSSALGAVGVSAGSVGIATVDGTGSSWTHSGDSAFLVGFFDGSTGTLALSNGGRINVNAGAGTVGIGANSGATGTINIGAALGATAVAAGTINAASVAFGGGTGNLVFNHTDTGYSFNPAITGSGAIGLYSGTTRFVGDLSAYTGTMTVDGGTLALTAGQTLYMPGGDYIQTSDGILRVDVTNDTTYGKLYALTATLPSNARIDVNVANPNFSFTASSLADIIETDGVLTSDGTFNVTDNSTLFDFGAVKDGNTVDLTFTAGGGGSGGGSTGVLSSVTKEGNNPATGAARVLDNLVDDFVAGSTGNTDMDTVIGALGRLSTSREVSDAVTQTLPLMTAGMNQVAVNTMHSTNRVIQARQDGNFGLSSGDDFLGDKKFWLKPVGSWTRQDNRKGVAGYDADTYGFVAGMDGEINDANRIGVAISYMNSNVDGKSTSSGNSADVDAYQAIVYGSRSLVSLPDTELNWQADVGLNKNKGQRRIDFGGLNRVAKSDYDSVTAHIGLGLARSYQLNDRTTVTPVVRADYTYIHDERYTEKGADALNLKVNSHSVDELTLMVEGRLSHQFTDKATFVANAGLGYDVLNDESSLTSAYVGGGTAFTTRGLDPSPWLGRAGLGLSVNATETTEITARYDLEARSDYLDQTASVKVRWAF